MSPDEEDDLDELTDIIVNGVPVDENHPNFESNLTPVEQDAAKKLFNSPRPLADKEK